jgi:hypothetical protein
VHAAGKTHLHFAIFYHTPLGFAHACQMRGAKPVASVMRSDQRWLDGDRASQVGAYRSQCRWINLTFKRSHLAQSDFRSARLSVIITSNKVFTAQYRRAETLES